MHSYTSELNLLQKIRVSSERVTALCLGNQGKQIAYCGVENGTFCALNVETGEILRKISQLHREKISGISVIENQSGARFILTQGWDNIVNLLDGEGLTVQSNSRIKLAYDEKKHFNTDSLRIIITDKGLYRVLCTGNNDKVIELL